MATTQKSKQVNVHAKAVAENYNVSFCTVADKDASNWSIKASDKTTMLPCDVKNYDQATGRVCLCTTTDLVVGDNVFWLGWTITQQEQSG